MLNFAFAFVFVSTMPAAVVHFLGFSLRTIFSRFARSLFIIDSVTPESMRALMVLVLVFLFFFPQGTCNLTNRIGVRCLYLRRLDDGVSSPLLF